VQYQKIKASFERYVQYKLWYLISQLIRNKQLSYDEFKSFEWFMKSKINFLRDYIKGGLDESTISDLLTIYYTFLKIHHICQKEFKKASWMFVYDLSDDEWKMLREMSHKLDAILSTMSVS
jgi:hypothetical protein